MNAIEELNRKAQAGDDKAQFDLGECYFLGEGVPQDFKEATYWMHKSAEQENKTAQYILGNCYENGDGVALDITEALKWFTKAAEQGLAEAFKWYRKAASQGLAMAIFNLGKCYYLGEGVAPNRIEGVFLIKKAAEQGYVKAQEALQKLQELGYC